MNFMKHTIPMVVRIIYAFLLALFILPFTTTSFVHAASGPDLVVSKVENGTFTQGDLAASYTITVTNNGDAATNGTVYVKIYPGMPTGLTAMTISGDEWTCDENTLECIINDDLGVGDSYPVIILTVEVALNAPSQVVTPVIVEGGDEPVDNHDNNNASAPTNIVQLPDLVINKIHDENFSQGDRGKTYTLTITNVGDAPTDGSIITVVNTLPSGLVSTAIGGDGWNCILNTLTCTRGGSLNNGESFPDITLTLRVAFNAPENVINMASISGGGDRDISNNTVEDSITIAPKPELIITTVTFSPVVPIPGQPFDVNVTVRNRGGEVTSSIVYRDIYINRDPSTIIDSVTGCPTDDGDYYRGEINDMIPPKVSDTKSVKITNGLAAGTYNIWAYADATCINDESIENNNVYGPIKLVIGAKQVFRSIGAHDGWILETAERSSKGGSLNKGATILQLGDDAVRKQYRAILSFRTNSLPDNAVITKVTLRIKRQVIVGGGNPVNIFQGFMVDIKRGSFGTPVLIKNDFQTKAQKTLGPIKKAAPNGWYVLNLTSGKNFINKMDKSNGLTQIRLSFKLDDNNNNKANILRLFSGNASVSNRPQLIVEYYVP
jgi:uncharacterized repeat protein (TIGR01451 family)